MRKQLLFAALAVFPFIESLAQLHGQKKLDSLLTALAGNHKEDTNRVKLLNSISFAYYAINPSAGINYGNEQLQLAKKLNWQKGIATAYNVIGVNTMEKSNYPVALDNYLKGLKIAEAIHHERLISIFIANIAIVYDDLGEHDKALEYYNKALAEDEAKGRQIDVAKSLANLGTMYTSMGKDSLALPYFVRAFRIMKDSNSLESMTYEASQIGGIYSRRHQYDSALGYHLSALKIAQQVNDPYVSASAQSTAGETYYNLAKDKNHSALIKYFGGNKMAALRLARNYTDSSIINFKMMGSRFQEAYKLRQRSDIEEEMGDLKSALQSYKLYTYAKDSVENADNAKKLTQTAMQYDFDKKEADAKAAQDKKDADAKRIKVQQYLLIAVLGVAVLAVVIIASIQYRNNRNKQKANYLLQQQNDKIEHTLSELRSTQAQLIQSEKMASLGQLTAGIAHEIQNPLNFVNNFSELNREMIAELKDELDKAHYEEAKMIASDIDANEAKIHAHGKRADAIVKGMLQHSRSGSGIKEPTDINALCAEYFRLSYAEFRSKDSTFTVSTTTDFDQSIGLVSVIPQDTGRVLLNLYNNAFYAVNEKLTLRRNQDEQYDPIVSVKSKRSGENILITVSDNGDGIPDNIIDKVFQPFFTTKPAGKGTGLGLSLSYDIVKAHGGKLNVITGVGKGTEFIIQLPCV